MKKFVKFLLILCLIVIPIYLLAIYSERSGFIDRITNGLSVLRSQVTSAYQVVNETVSQDGGLATGSLVPHWDDGNRGDIISAPPSSPASATTTPTAETYWGDTGVDGLKVYEYGKTLLDSDEQNIYNQIADSVQNVKSSVTFVSSDDSTGIEKIYEYYLYDHSEVFYLDNANLLYRTYAGGLQNEKQYEIDFTYRYSPATVSSMRLQMGAAALSILKSIGSTTSDLDKEKALHNALIKNCTYDIKAENAPDSYTDSYTAFGAFVNKTAVCDGYARAMKILLSSAGIKSLYVAGTVVNEDGSSGSHAWNEVQISNEWYYLDPTFDDPVYYNSKGELDMSHSTISTTYFNYTTSKNHKLGIFNVTNPFSDGSENYQLMPNIG